jgi:TIR domain-containing protein
MGPGSTYDVFFSYSGVDKAEVELLATRLQREAGLLPFLDKWHLVPGEPWQPELERAIEQSSTAAIFFGPQGRGARHIEEMQVLLDKAARSRNDFRSPSRGQSRECRANQAAERRHALPSSARSKPAARHRRYKRPGDSFQESRELTKTLGFPEAIFCGHLSAYNRNSG